MIESLRQAPSYRRAGLPIVACLLAIFALGAGIPRNAQAQLPYIQLNTINPTGGKAGASVEVKVTGLEMDDVDKILFSHPGITAEQKMSEGNALDKTPQPIAGEFTVKVAENVPVGIYEARIAGRYGISNPRAFVVGSLNEINEEGTHNKPDLAMELPIGTTVNGRADKDTIDYYRLSLKKGERVLIDCAGQRVDSKIDASLVIYDSAGTELRRARDVINRDPVLDFEAPEEGDYVLAVYDFVYEGGTEYLYRLSVHKGPFIDFVFPPVGVPGSSGKYTVYGRNLPGGKPVPGQPLEQLTVDIKLPSDAASVSKLPVATVVEPQSSMLRGKLFDIDSPAGRSNPVTINYASAPVTVESEPGNDLPEQAEEIQVPCEYVGQFSPRGDRDWVTFEAKQGETYFLELLSHRLGHDTDGFLLIEKVVTADDGTETVSQVAVVDDPKYDNPPADMMFDIRNNDPSYVLKVDADATYRVLVKDLFVDSRSDPRLTYRLVITRHQPNFSLVAFAQPRLDARKQIMPGACVLRRGGAQAIRVRCFRQYGFDGEVALSIEGLPSGVTCAGATLGADQRTGLLVVEAAENAAAFAGPIRVIGKAMVDGKEVARQARGGTLLWTTASNMPRSARVVRDMALAVLDKETAAVAMKVGDGKVLETSRGGKLELPVALKLREKLKGDVKLDAIGLPKEMLPKSVTVKGESGKMEVALTQNGVKPGVYTFYLRGTTKFSYARNQDAVKEAEAEKKRMEGVLKDLTDKAKAATAAKTEATKTATTAAAALKTAQTAATAAATAVTQAQAAAKAAGDKFKAAEAAAKKDAENKALATAATAAKKASDDAAAKVKEAETKLAAAKKAQDDATAKNTEATKARTEAETAEKAALDLAKLADTRKKAADKAFTDATNLNKAKDINLEVVSSPIQIRVADAPINVKLGAVKPLQQGEKLTVPVTIERLYGFEDAIDVTIELPRGVAGITAAKLNVAKGKTQGSLELTAAKTATPGDHEVKIKSRVKFNNVTIDQSDALALKITPAPAEEKK